MGKKIIISLTMEVYDLCRQGKQLRDCSVNVLTVLQKNQAQEWKSLKHCVLG